MPDPVLDARGVEIAAGDTVIYGFGVGRSVAMAEGVVLGETKPCVGPNEGCEPGYQGGYHSSHCSAGKLSLTPTGMVRVRVVRRSYSSGEKPVVAIRPDRFVVLKEQDGPFQPTVPEPCFALPPSPLPTQNQVARKTIQTSIDYMESCLADPEGTITDHWEGDVDRYVGYYAKALAKERAKLKELDDGAEG